MRFPGRAFVDALASLGDTLEDEPSWGHLGANIETPGEAWGTPWGDLLGGPRDFTWKNLRKDLANLTRRLRHLRVIFL